ncbi:uncharacterized protein LOC119390458 [Rhipicephalus sanguineus]|uniref:uncharacterized protein LOC119390458 n=1 Tax=Rhipicephalus sanguineus TaxID=34632 RepID=UPI0018937AA8|nr:uncharacterized protein LOC119390458 [Rhipicephalus sanguineus]
MHLGTKTSLLMLLSVVLASALRTEGQENGCHESTASPKDVQTDDQGCHDGEHRDQYRFRGNRNGAMDSRRNIFGKNGDDAEEDRAFERLASLAKYARSKLPFVNQRSRTSGQTNHSCSKV